MRDRAIRYISLFSGIEAASVAWSTLGWKPLYFCEIDAFPSAVLAAHYPDIPNLGDITKVNWKNVRKKHGTVDVVVGGSPCQSFSIAGNRTGLDGASGLMWEYVRAVRELRPKWFVWENVPGALTSTGGQDYRCLLNAMAQLGYGMAWRVLDAQFFGVPQRRERVFLVGCAGDPTSAAEVLFERESLSWDFVTGRKKRAELTASLGASTANTSAIRMREGHTGSGDRGPLVSDELSLTPATSNDQVVFALSGALSAQPGMKQTTYITDLWCVSDTAANSAIDENLSGTLQAHISKGGAFVNKPCIRKLTPRECERLQGFPDDWTLIPYRGKPVEECPDAPRYKALGNSMAVPVMRWIGERIEMVEHAQR